ncbi:MAG: electron transfer flavoprotein subunit alpha/FixB family protein [Candidatus Cloacimonadales bacterium]|jgi:electron transfer flavoprotein alpha subunit|nr:electron transfer flavoprotein subunit alpha/FixB family protein [Candidatus Cloacimonadota bacterium]MDX9977969.1 electron transfer flavoprotein subunit alpha/FixB family protein [Candidatus Cloacimonadales bacterium]
MEEKTYKGILVIGEQRQGNIQNGTFELLGKARELAAKIDCEVSVLLLGNALNEEHGKKLAKYGADNIYLANDSYLHDYSTEPYAKIICQFINEHKPEIAMISATSIGRDLAPRISARLHTGLTADCTSLDIEENTNNLLMTRPAFGGNILATIICPDHRPQMSTVRPGVFQKQEFEVKKPLKINCVKADIHKEDLNIEILDTVFEKTEKKNIEEANILVSAGRGIGKKENIANLEALAKELGGLVSGSRAVVDAGWIEQHAQVGQTGKTVRPDVYIACGISGAIQHIAGMEESDLIIAINKNPEAPIFANADLGIVADANQLIPALIEELKIEIP